MKHDFFFKYELLSFVIIFFLTIRNKICKDRCICYSFQNLFLLNFCLCFRKFTFFFVKFILAVLTYMSFFKACKELTFGRNCELTCGHCFNGEICDHVTGTCSNGCAPGWTGPICDQSKRERERERENKAIGERVTVQYKLLKSFKKSTTLLKMLFYFATFLIPL